MVYILLAPGFEEAEGLVPADLLRRAGIETVLVSTQGGPVTGGQGITVQADLALWEVNLLQAKMIVLPGGRGGVAALGGNPAVEALCQEASELGVPLAAICAGPTLLGRYGLLQGKKAVCYPGLEGELTGASVCSHQHVVADGELITAKAAGSAFDFGLMLIEHLAGEKKAAQIRQAICYDR